MIPQRFGKFAVEWIKIRLSSDVQKFLQKDYEIWTLDHMVLPYYRGKEIWIDQHNPNICHCVLYWESHELWKSMPRDHVKGLYQWYYRDVGNLIEKEQEVTSDKLIFKTYENEANNHNSQQKQVNLQIYTLNNIPSNKAINIVRQLRIPCEIWQQQHPNMTYLLAYSPNQKIVERVQRQLRGELIQKVNKISEFKKNRLIQLTN